MPTYLSHFGQEDIPNIEYFGASREIAEHIVKAAGGLPGYEVTFMPIDTPEEALATAQERANHLQAVGEARARKLGAAFIISANQEPTPEELGQELHSKREDYLYLRVRMPEGASYYALVKDYYDAQLGPEAEPEQ